MKGLKLLLAAIAVGILGVVCSLFDGLALALAAAGISVVLIFAGLLVREEGERKQTDRLSGELSQPPYRQSGEPSEQDTKEKREE